MLPFPLSCHFRAFVLCASWAALILLFANTANAANPFIVEGFQDGADCTKIFGWAWDSTIPNSPISVDIYDGSTKIATVSANEFRSDLTSKGNGLHAFNFITPGSLKNGVTHSITVKFANTQFNLSNTPKTLGPCSSTSIPPIPGNPSPGTTTSPGPTLSSSTVTLSWSASSGATTYGVGVRDLSTNLLVVDANTSNISFTANLSPGRPYRWNVNACNSAGCSSFTTLRFFQTPGAIPPVPGNPSPGTTTSPGPTLSSSTVTLSWSASSGATTYGVGVRDLSTNLLVVDANTTNTSFTANLSPGRPYRWNVNACNSAGCSSFTTLRFFQTPGAIPPVPGNPSPGTTTSPGPTLSSSTVTLSWSASSGATTYGVGVRDLSTNLLVVDANTSNTSFTANLTPGRPYRWNVNACNSSGCSSFTTLLHFQTPGTIPPIPANPSPGTTTSPGPTLSSSTVTLSWSASSGATTYGVGVRDLSTNLLVVDANTSNTSFTANLTPGRPYRWNVNACNSSGCSSFTTLLHFQTPGSGPGSFTLSNTSAICDTNPPAAPAVRLNWSQSSGATSYELHRNGGVYVASLTGLTFYNNLNVFAGQTYVYFVRARNSSGSKDSNSITVTVPSNICASASPPSISNINPSNVTVDQVTVLTVNGANFKSGFSASVTTSLGTFGIDPVGLTFVNSNQVLVQVRMGGTPPLSATLKIINLDGLSATGIFQVVAQQQTPGSFSLSNQAPLCDTNAPVGPAVRLNWTASNNATSYDLHRNGALYAASITGTTFYNSANVVAGQTYTYFIRARNASGTRDSNTVNVTVPSNICLNSTPAPVISRITPGTVTVNEVTTLTIIGSNFQSNFAVKVQGNAIDPSGLKFFDSGTVTASVKMGGTPPYSATLVLTNLSDGKSASGSFTVAAPSSQSQAPTASFTHSPTSPAVGQSVQFTDSSTGSGLTRSWDFNGDGSVDSQAQNPTHTFATAGPYEVTLRVSNAYGTDSFTKTITVGTTSAGGSPVVLDVVRKYSGFFLKGSGLDNVYDVKVDWKGSPGTVSFSINGGPASVRQGTSTGASFTFNLDRDLQAKFTPSSITITPRNGEGVTGASVSRSVYVFPYPSWLELTLQRNSSALAFTAGSGYINANLNFDFPNPHLAANGPIDIPTWVPYIGGKFGLNETYAQVGGTLSSAGTGSIRVGGRTGFTAMGNSIDGSVFGSGNFLLNEKGLSLLSTSFNVTLSGTLQKEIGVVDAIPQLAGLQETPVIGTPLRWFNDKAKLVGEVKPQLSFGANWQQNSAGDLQFNSATGDLGLELRGTLKIEPFDHIQARGWVAGGGSIGLGVPSPFVRSLDLTFESGVELNINYLWTSAQFTKKAAFRCRWTPTTGTSCGREESATADALRAVESSDIPLTLISPSFDKHGKYSNFNPLWTFKSGGLVPAASTGELSLISNVFPAAAPQITELGSGSLLVWVHQNPLLPVLQSTNISWAYNSGADTWTIPSPTTDDTRAELYPVVASSGSGRVVAAWLRIRDANFNTSIDTTAQLPLFFNRFDVVSSVFDSSTRQWSPVTSITDDAAFDNALRISSDHAGSLLLTWLSNAGGEFTSTQSHPSTLKYSFWNGSAWATPAAITSNLVGVNSTVHAINGNSAFIVVPRDPDPNSTNDGVLDLYKWNGTSWSGPTQFAAGGVENRLASAVYSGNEGHVVWLRNNDLVHANLTDPTPQVIRKGSSSMAFYNVRLVNN